ncbi:MAG: hypothetical protein K2I93_07305 [Oscillospiraceae bacterium]|nr:hypothetical protein [Oscillospiraceae bacterium]
MNWKLMAIIVATAVATAAAVVMILQKQNDRRRMRFDSSEFDEDDFMDDIACGEQCNFVDDDLDAMAAEVPEDVVPEQTDEAKD